MLECKADWYGRQVVVIDRFYPSSKTCSACGRVEDAAARSGVDLPVWQRPRSGRECGEEHSRRWADGDSLRRWCETVPHIGAGRQLSVEQET